MNQGIRIRVFFCGLLLAVAILMGISLNNRGKAPSASPPAPREQKDVTTLPVEIIEKGKPTQVIEVPVQHQSIPEIGVLVLAPLGWLILLRRHK